MQGLTRSQQKTSGGSASDRNRTDDMSSLHKYGRGFGLVSRNKRILAYSSGAFKGGRKEFRVVARSNSKKQEDERSQKSLKSVPKEQRLMAYREVRQLKKNVTNNTLRKMKNLKIHGSLSRSRGILVKP